MLKKFGIISITWFFLASAALYFLSPFFKSDFLTFFFVFLWAQTDLLLIAKLMGTLFQFMKEKDVEIQATLKIRMLLWGTLKVSCLLVGVVLLWSGLKITGLALFLGLASLFVVPLIGGVLLK